MDFFDAAYRGTPPWDIGRPQKEFVELVRRGEITGSVLDIGCGTGEHALFFAAEGHEVWGIDSAPLAIGKAQEKAKAQGLAVHFLVRDALDLASLNRTFDTATDSGLFHTLSDEDRPVFEKSLASVLSPGGDLLHALLQRPGAPRVRSEEDCGKGDTGELQRAGLSITSGLRPSRAAPGQKGPVPGSHR